MLHLRAPQTGISCFSFLCSQHSLLDREQAAYKQLHLTVPLWWACENQGCSPISCWSNCFTRQQFQGFQEPHRPPDHFPCPSIFWRTQPRYMSVTCMLLLLSTRSALLSSLVPQSYLSPWFMCGGWNNLGESQCCHRRHKAQGGTWQSSIYVAIEIIQDHQSRAL